MKLLILFFIGLVVGAMGATTVINTLRQRDAFARGVMDVVQHHYATLRENLRAQHCEETASAYAIGQMRVLSTDIDAAVYGNDTPDAPFREFDARLASTLADAAAANPKDCATLAPHVQALGKVCDECHQRYR